MHARTDSDMPHTGHLGLFTEPEHGRHLRKQTLYRHSMSGQVEALYTAPASAEVVINKTALLRTASDCVHLA